MGCRGVGAIMGLTGGVGGVRGVLGAGRTCSTQARRGIGASGGFWGV